MGFKLEVRAVKYALREIRLACFFSRLVPFIELMSFLQM